ncbi:hypothetical protein AAE478_006142 [Parahypoxylon ruwenzoriense]
MFPTLVRRMAGESLPLRLRSAAATARRLPAGVDSQYKLKKVWPPDFSKLSEKEQFRFERRYKRRVKLAMARPRWDKFVKLAQLFTLTSVLVYAILFMEPNTENKPFQALRDRFWGVFGAFTPKQRFERRDPDIATITNAK